MRSTSSCTFAPGSGLMSMRAFSASARNWGSCLVASKAARSAFACSADRSATEGYLYCRQKEARGVTRVGGVAAR
jgi:hypothetical protein